MSDKSNKKSNALEKAMGRIRDKIFNKKKTVKSKPDFAHFMTWIARYKKSSFAQRHPTATTDLVCLSMMIAVWAGVNNYDKVSDTFVTMKEWMFGADKKDAQSVKHTYGAYLNQIRPITPLLIANVLTYEGLVTDENGMHVVYDDSNSKALAPGQKAAGTPTICIGCTKDPYDRQITSYTAPVTPEDAYVFSVSHIERKETYFYMYCYAMAGIRPQNTNQALALASVIYNTGANLFEKTPDAGERFANLRKLYAKYGNELPDSVVQAEFAARPIKDMEKFGDALRRGKINKAADLLGLYTWGKVKVNGKWTMKDLRGLWVRRFVEAGILLGKVEPMHLMNVPVKHLAEFLEIMGGKKRAFFTGSGDNIKLNHATFADLNKWLQNPVDRYGKPIKGKILIREALAPDVIAFCDAGKCVLGGKEVFEVETQLVHNLRMYEHALRCCANEDYAAAEISYNQILQTDKNNALIYNDLAFVCIKMERYDDALNYCKKVISGCKGASPKELGAAYYNAGIAAERKNQPARALENYRLAIAKGNDADAVKECVRRLEKRLNLNTGKAKVKNAVRAKNMRTQRAAKNKKSAR